MYTYRRYIVLMGDERGFSNEESHLQWWKFIGVPFQPFTSIHTNSYWSILRAFEQRLEKTMLNDGIYIWIYSLPMALETKIDSLYTWECIVVRNRRAKREEFDHQSYEDSTNSSPNWFRKNKVHLFWLQILLQTLESIISHHKKSASISYNAKSKAILHLQLIFTNVSNLQSTHFSVENSQVFFFFFFFFLYTE